MVPKAMPSGNSPLIAAEDRPYKRNSRVEKNRRARLKKAGITEKEIIQYTANRINLIRGRRV